MNPAFVAKDIIQLKKQARSQSQSYRLKVANYLDSRKSRPAHAVVENLPSTA